MSDDEKIHKKICPECGEPYEGTLMEHLMKTRPDIVSEQIENLKTEHDTLKKQLQDVNYELEQTIEKWDKEVNNNCDLIRDLGHAQLRLAEVETSLKIANEGLFTSNKITDDQGKRLAEVGNIVNSTYENEVKFVRAVCHNYMKEPLYEEKLQEVVLFHLKNFKTSLEAAFCGGWFWMKHKKYLCIHCKQGFDEVPLQRPNECPSGHSHDIIKLSAIVKRKLTDPYVREGCGKFEEREVEKK